MPLPDVAGALYITRMPGAGGPGTFEADSQAIVDHDIDYVVSLVQPSEIEWASRDYARALQRDALPWERVTFPIPDHDAPSAQRRDAFLQLAQAVATDLQAGQRIAIHCYAGRGRSGTLAVAVLLALGLPRDEALARVQEANPRAGPEVPAQEDLVAWVAGQT